MRKETYHSLIFLLALASCSKLPATAESGATEAKTSFADKRSSDGDSNALSNANVMACSVDNGTMVNVKGAEVGIGSFGITNNHLNLTLNISEETKGKYVRVGTGIFTFPMVPGKYESVGADYATGNETSEKKYTSVMYPLYFSTSRDDPLAKSEINIKQVEKGPADSGLLVRTHVVGEARFLAVYAPNPRTEACAQDLVERVTNGLTNPMYNAAVCGAEKVKVECKFDITADVADLGTSTK
jgi:hypothetical protein